MFTKGQWITLGLIVIASMVLVVGCSAEQPAVATFPVGATFRAIDNQAGEFTIEYKADNTYALTGPTHEGPANFSGAYTVTGNQIVVKGLTCEGSDKETGTYIWNFDGSKLIFSVVKDTCYERWRVFNYVWAKKQ